MNKKQEEVKKLLEFDGLAEAGSKSEGEIAIEIFKIYDKVKLTTLLSKVDGFNKTANLNMRQDFYDEIDKLVIEIKEIDQEFNELDTTDSIKTMMIQKILKGN